MYQVTIRKPDTIEPLATATAATWEEASFNAYDELMRAKGERRRYLAYVEESPWPGRKLVRFGFRSMADRLVNSDPLVTIDVELVR